MLVAKSYKLPEFLYWTRRSIYALLVISAVPVFCYQVLGMHWLVVPWSVVLLLGTAVALMAGFKNTQTYGRTWEAQKVWAAILAGSRNWGTMCRDLVDDPEEAKKLIYRHLAWLTTLRYAMRQGRAWETVESAPNAEYLRAYKIPEKESSLESELARFLPRDEVDPILRASNTAGWVLNLQDQAIKDLLDRKLLLDSAFAQMRAAIATMHARQCDSELIKNFPYPRQYAIVNTIFVRILCLLLPLAMINELGKLNSSVGGFMEGNMVWLAIPMSMLVSWMYTSLDQVGESTANPFEGGANDVPISQICLEIEIGMKEVLGEVCEPVQDRMKHDILL